LVIAEVTLEFSIQHDVRRGLPFVDLDDRAAKDIPCAQFHRYLLAWNQFGVVWTAFRKQSGASSVK
jgi:hypothetical protein